MDTTIGAVYAVCDDMLNGLQHRNDPQCHLTDAEVIEGVQKPSWF